MSKILIIIFLSLFVGFLFLLYINRGAPKIQETLIVVTIALIGAIAYVTKPTEINKDITSVYIVDRSDKKNSKLMFFDDEPIIFSYFFHHYYIYNGYIHKLKEQANKDNLKTRNNIPIFNINDKDDDFLVELLTTALIEHFCRNYQASWYVEKNSAKLPSGTFQTWTPKKPEETKSIKFSVQDLPDPIKKNRFFDYLTFGLNEISLPPNTKIDFCYVGKGKSIREVIIKKKYFFEIRFRIAIRGGSAGLGEFGSYVGITDPDLKIYDMSDPNFINYFVYSGAIICSAKFNRFTAGHPDTAKYIEWVNNMFELLYKEFEWSPTEKAFKENHIHKAAMKILSDK